jgi:hypothetical protein
MDEKGIFVFSTFVSEALYENRIYRRRESRKRRSGFISGDTASSLSGYCSRNAPVRCRRRRADPVAGVWRHGGSDRFQRHDFSTVPDRALAKVDAQAAALLQGRKPSDHVWIHTSGALASDCLEN